MRVCLHYSKLASGSQDVGRPRLRYEDVCKRDMKACNIDSESWEVTAENRTRWKQHVSHAIKRGESSMYDAAKDKRARRNASHQNEEVTSTDSHDASDFTCQGLACQGYNAVRTNRGSVSKHSIVRTL